MRRSNLEIKIAVLNELMEKPLAITDLLNKSSVNSKYGKTVTKDLEHAKLITKIIFQDKIHFKITETGLEVLKIWKSLTDYLK